MDKQKIVEYIEKLREEYMEEACQARDELDLRAEIHAKALLTALTKVMYAFQAPNGELYEPTKKEEIVPVDEPAALDAWLEEKIKQYSHDNKEYTKAGMPGNAHVALGKEIALKEVMDNLRAGAFSVSTADVFIVRIHWYELFPEDDDKSAGVYQYIVAERSESDALELARQMHEEEHMDKPIGWTHTQKLRKCDGSSVWRM